MKFEDGILTKKDMGDFMKGELAHKVQFSSECSPSYSGFRRSSSFVLTLSFEGEDAPYSAYLKEAKRYIEAEIARVKAEKGGGDEMP